MRVIESLDVIEYSKRVVILGPQYAAFDALARWGREEAIAHRVVAAVSRWANRGWTRRLAGNVARTRLRKL